MKNLNFISKISFILFFLSASIIVGCGKSSDSQLPNHGFHQDHSGGGYFDGSHNNFGHQVYSIENSCLTQGGQFLQHSNHQFICILKSNSKSFQIGWNATFFQLQYLKPGDRVNILVKSGSFKDKLFAHDGRNKHSVNTEKEIIFHQSGILSLGINGILTLNNPHIEIQITLH